MTPPLVDVILPHYRGDRFLAESLQSLRDQTSSDWQLTIIDDGSDDDSIDTLRRLVAADPRNIQLMLGKGNKGAAAARMDAIGGTRGEFIAFLDQDDRWHAEKLAQQIAFLRSHPNSIGVHTDIVIIDADGRPVPGGADGENHKRAVFQWDGSRDQVSAGLFRDNCVRLISSMVRRDAFEGAGGFDRRLRGGEDWDFWVRFSHTGRIDHLPACLLERRVNGGNTVITQGYPRSLGRLQAWRKLTNQLPHLRPLARQRRVQLLRKARDMARAERRHGRVMIHAIQHAIAALSSRIRA